MSDIEPLSVRLEDGEIDEGDDKDEPSSALASTSSNVGSSLSNLKAEIYPESNNKNHKNNADISPKMAALDEAECKEQPNRTESRRSSFQRVYQNEDSSDFIGEDEMLCVRGASPLPFAPNLKRRPSPYDSDSLTIDIRPPKRRKASGKKRRRKKSSPKKVSKEKNISSDDQNDRSSKETSPPPSEQKLHQLCKFYLQECCAKGSNCEYMHSEFPCKFFHMGLKCEDELADGKCKLSHGGTLSSELLVALIRHIHTAPNDVLGKKFVDLRSKMPAGEVSKMLHETQEKLQFPESKSEPSTSVAVESTFTATLKDKLYFLNEEQISKLQLLRITKFEDLLYLTLAQLNAIGIHAAQIEAIQMSLISGKDMDMRNIFVPPPAKTVEVLLDSKDVDNSKEVVCSEDENEGQNWYEREEQPLVIDESEDDAEDWDKLNGLDEDAPESATPSRTETIYVEQKNDDDGEKLCNENESNHFSIECNAPNSSDTAPSTESIDYKPLKDDGTCSTQTQSTWLLNSVENNSAANRINEHTNSLDIPLGTPDAWNDLNMQHSSSEDWDALEQDDAQSQSKEIVGIDSPDNSEDDSNSLVTNGMCPQLPLRTPNLDNYTPALEIDAHLTYPAMEYKLYEVYLPDSEVNRPPLMDKLLKSNSIDPRLKKFADQEKNLGILPQTDYSFFPPAMSHCDPRLRPGYGNVITEPQYYNASPILYGYLQRSLWYQQLKSNLKIQINHSISDLVRALNAFHKDSSPKKIFDLFKIECAGVLLEVMRNVGIFIDVNGNITEEGNYQALCVPQPVPRPYNNHNCNNNNASGSSMKPGLLGFAPPGVHPANSENSFIRQAFGNNNFQNMHSNQVATSECGFYIPERNFNNDRGPPEPSFRRLPNRNFKRRL